MPLYEIVLRVGDREETRLTDRHCYAVGGEVEIEHRRFRVAGIEPSATPGARERIVLEPLPVRGFVSAA